VTEPAVFLITQYDPTHPDPTPPDERVDGYDGVTVRAAAPETFAAIRAASHPCAIPGINLDTWISPISRGFGQPCSGDLRTITLSHGARVSVHSSLAELVGLIMNANEAQGYIYRPADTGAYNCRANRNNPSASSWHSFGIAIDANWTTNPNRYPVVTDRPAWEIARWNRYGFGWGGDYEPSNPPDTMHTEFHGTVAQAGAALALARQELGDGVAPTPAPPSPVPAPNGFGLPAGHYYGLITGPNESHGGINVAEQVAVRKIQVRLQELGYAPAGSSWADGRFEQPTADAVASWQRVNMPGTTRFGEVWADDWAKLFSSTNKPKPAPAPAPAGRVVPAWTLPAGHYYGLITGPARSHGGVNPDERVAVTLIQQALQRWGFAPSSAGWADGRFEQPTADAVTAWQRKNMPGTTFFGQVWADDWRKLLAR